LSRARLRAGLDAFRLRDAMALARARHRVRHGMQANSSFVGTVLAVVASALIAGAITVLTAATDQVEASAPIMGFYGDADRRPIGPQCSQQAWPYYEAHCVRDLRPQSTRGRSARVVTIDRQ
jgi:hypothetical protein